MLLFEDRNAKDKSNFHLRTTDSAGKDAMVLRRNGIAVPAHAEHCGHSAVYIAHRLPSHKKLNKYQFKLEDQTVFESSTTLKNIKLIWRGIITHTYTRRNAVRVNKYAKLS